MPAFRPRPRFILIIDAEELESAGTSLLDGAAAVWCRVVSVVAALKAKFCCGLRSREQGALSGICYGLHAAVIDLQGMPKLDRAHTTEVDEHAPHPVIALTEWTISDGRVERRSQSGDLGGTMRLGEQPVCLIGAFGRAGI